MRADRWMLPAAVIVAAALLLRQDAAIGFDAAGAARLADGLT